MSTWNQIPKIEQLLRHFFPCGRHHGWQVMALASSQESYIAWEKIIIIYPQKIRGLAFTATILPDDNTIKTQGNPPKRREREEFSGEKIQ